MKTKWKLLLALGLSALVLTGCEDMRLNQTHQGYNLGEYNVKEPETSIEDEGEKIRGDYGRILAGKDSTPETNNTLEVPEEVEDSGQGTGEGAGKWDIVGGVDHPLPPPEAHSNQINGGFYESRPKKGGGRRHHYGYDISPLDDKKTKVQKMEIRSPADGVIKKAEYQNGAGNMVVVECYRKMKDGTTGKWDAIFFHMKDDNVVKVGQKVKKGEKLGYYGGTGGGPKGTIGYATHMHFEVGAMHDGKNKRYSAMSTLFGYDGSTYEEIEKQSGGFYHASHLAGKDFKNKGGFVR